MRKMLVIILGVLIFFAVCWFGVGGAALGIKINLVVLGSFFLFLPLLSLVGYNLTKFHTVSCDLIGCEVTASGRWRRSQTNSFRWDEVIDTRITSQVLGRAGRILYFGVAVKDKWIILMQTGSAFPIKDLTKLIAMINERTAHLPYVWVEHKPVNDRQVIQKVGIYYYKVARS